MKKISKLALNRLGLNIILSIVLSVLLTTPALSQEVTPQAQDVVQTQEAELHTVKKPTDLSTDELTVNTQKTQNPQKNQKT